MSTTSQLENWAEKNISNFYGVYSADTLPNPQDITPLGSIIVNYDTHDKPGSHWVAIIITQNSVDWFDSFGMKPDADDLILGHKTYFHRWLKELCQRLGIKSYSYNTADLQALSGKTCGHYSLWFCKNGPKKGWKNFGPDREKNDLVIQQLVRL